MSSNLASQSKISIFPRIKSSIRQSILYSLPRDVTLGFKRTIFVMESTESLLPKVIISAEGSETQLLYIPTTSVTSNILLSIR